MGNEQREKGKRMRQMIDAAGSICILGHIRPDGDCVGSTLAMYNYILDNFVSDNSAGKTVDIYLEAFPAAMKFLNGAKKVKHETTGKHYDLAISMDVSDPERLGKFSDLFLTAISTICIDHHVSNAGFGDLCYVDPDASSACEAFADLIDPDQISLNTANCLYLGMVHDTGVFKYSATSRHTMELAGLMLEKGEDGKVIYGYVSRDTFKEFKANTMDTEGIVEQLRLTDGVEVAVFVYQLTKKTFKVSMRAKNYVDVSVIASAFGGGGHVRAAGFDGTGTIEKTLPMLLEEIKKQLK